MDGGGTVNDINQTTVTELHVYIQWDLHIKDTLGPGILSFI